MAHLVSAEFFNIPSCWCLETSLKTQVFVTVRAINKQANVSHNMLIKFSSNLADLLLNLILFLKLQAINNMLCGWCQFKFNFFPGGRLVNHQCI